MEILLRGDILSFLYGVIATSSDGEIYLVNSSGKVVSGFPISTGVQNIVSPAIVYCGIDKSEDVTTLAVLGSDNRLNVWSIGLFSFPFLGLSLW